MMYRPKRVWMSLNITNTYAVYTRYRKMTAACSKSCALRLLEVAHEYEVLGDVRAFYRFSVKKILYNILSKQ